MIDYGDNSAVDDYVGGGRRFAAYFQGGLGPLNYWVINRVGAAVELKGACRHH